MTARPSPPVPAGQAPWADTPQIRDEVERATASCAATGEDFDQWFDVCHPRGSSLWLSGGGAIGNRPKPAYLQQVDGEIAAWFDRQQKLKKSLEDGMDKMEERIQFKDDTPAIYGGLGNFYSVSLQDLQAGKELFLKVEAPGLKEKIKDPAVQEQLLAHFRGRVYLRSKDRSRPEIPLEVVRIAGWEEGNNLIEHPDHSHMETIALNKKNPAILKVAFRLKDPTLLADIKDREFFEIVQPDRAGETMLISNNDDPEFSVDHVADLHVRLDDYREKLVFARNVLDRIERLYQLRAIDAPTALRLKWGWYRYTENLVINYTEQVRSWLRWEKERYKGGKIDFVVVHGDEIDYVNDSKSLAQRTFHEENTRLLAYLLDEAGIPVAIETGNHTRHRPRYHPPHHPPHMNTDPNSPSKSRSHEVAYFTKTVDAAMRLGIQTGNYAIDIPRELISTAAGEPQVIDHDGGFFHGVKTFVKNLGVTVKELFASDLFEEAPTRQTTDDQFRGNQYLYINSEPNFIHRYKGHAFVLSDSGGEDFRFGRFMNEVPPPWLREGLAKYLLLPLMPGFWDGVIRYVGDKEVPVKGFPDAEFSFLVDQAVASHRGESSPESTLKVTQSSHNPLFHYLDRLWGDDFASNTLNWKSRRPMLLYYWFFRPLFGTVIAGHIHTWEAYWFDFNLAPEEEKKLAQEIAEEFHHIATHAPDGSAEHFLEEMNKIWENHDLDNHIVVGIPPKSGSEKALAGEDGDRAGVAAFLKGFDEMPERHRPPFITLEAIGPTDDQDPAGVLTETVRDGRTVRLEGTSLFFNKDGSVAAVPLAESRKESDRRKERAARLFPPRPPEPPLPANDPYEGIFP